MKFSSKGIKVLTLICLSLFLLSNVLSIFNVYQVKQLREQAFEGFVKEPFTLHRPENVNILGDFYYPKNFTEGKAYPLVFLQHGMGSRKENFQAMGTMFLERGFVVATLTLRNHYGSGGHTTIGQEESNDLLSAIPILKEKATKLGFSISNVGVVGHSLGGLTVTLAAIKGHLNSCVAIAPPTNLSKMVESFTGITFEKFGKYFHGFNNLADPEYIANITLMGQPAPKNCLLIAGDGDASVDPKFVEELFLNFTGNNSARPFTLYGNFSLGTALQYDLFTVANHGAEQFPFFEPEIAIAAINWTERSLGINNSNPIILNYRVNILKNANSILSTTTSVYYNILLLSGIMLIYLILLQIKMKKTQEIPKVEVEAESQDKSTMKTIIIRKSGIIGAIIGAIGGIFLKIIYTPFLIFQAFFAMAWPIIIGGYVGIIIGVLLQKQKNPKNNNISGILNKDSLRSRGLGLLLGVSFGLGVPYLLVFLTNIASGEHWLKPLAQISELPLVFIQMILSCLLFDVYNDLVLFNPNLTEKHNVYNVQNNQSQIKGYMVVFLWILIFTLIGALGYYISTPSLCVGNRCIPFFIVGMIPIIFILGLILTTRFLFRQVFNHGWFSVGLITTFGTWLLLSTFIAF